MQTFQKFLTEKYDGRIGPAFKVLKKNEVPLADAERDEVLKAKAVWHHGPNGEPSSAVWKAEVNGKTWYATNTHRAYNVTPTLKGTIRRYHEFIKGTS